MALNIIEHRTKEISEGQFRLFKTCYEKMTGREFVDEYIEAIKQHNYYDYGDTKYAHKIIQNPKFTQPAILFTKTECKDGFPHFYIDIRLYDDMLEIYKED